MNPTTKRNNKPAAGTIAWWAIVVCAIASSFYIAGTVTLTKIGFLILIIGYPIVKGSGITKYPKADSIDYLLYSFALLSGATVIYATDRAEWLGHYASLASCILLYWTCRSLIESKQAWAEVVLKSFVWATMVSSAFGVVQAMTGRLFVPGTEERSISTNDIFRANGLFTDPNYLGYILTMAWPVAAQAYRRAPIVRNIICLFLLAAAVLTLSRATMIIVALQVFGIALLSSSDPRKLLLRLSILVAIIIPAVIFTNPFGAIDRLFSIAPIFLDSDVGVDNSVAERIDLLSAGAKMFFDHFWLGVGFGNFQVLSASYMDFFPRSVYAHNSYLTIAAESGVIGISIYLLFLYLLGRKLYRLRQKYLIFSLLGLVASNFFLVAHYFPITYVYFAALVGLRSANGATRDA